MRKEVLAPQQARIALFRISSLGRARERHSVPEAAECWPRWSSCSRHHQSLQKTEEAVVFSVFFFGKNTGASFDWHCNFLKVVTTVRLGPRWSSSCGGIMCERKCMRLSRRGSHFFRSTRRHSVLEATEMLAAVVFVSSLLSALAKAVLFSCVRRAWLWCCVSCQTKLCICDMLAEPTN